MSVIYGGISIMPDSDWYHKTDLVKHESSWNKSILQEIRYGQFRGGVYRDSRLPYKFRDMICLNKKKEILILMSGNIYNREELCDSFQIEKNNISEPEIILNLFLKQGIAFANLLNGDFAICIYLKKQNKIFIIRDHLGICPISFITINNSFYFSSSTSALSKTFANGSKINRKYILKQLNIFPVNRYPITPIKGIIRLLPGHYFEFSKIKSKIHKYWNPEVIATDNNLKLNDVKQELGYILADAVKIRADKRFNAGSHISGGLDSGVVTALVRKEYSKQTNFVGFSWASDAQEYDSCDSDERILINKIFELYNITPSFQEITP